MSPEKEIKSNSVQYVTDNEKTEVGKEKER